MTTMIKNDIKSLSPGEEPKFPYVAMFFISLGMLAHSVVFTSPLPYVAFMVVDFKIASNLDEAGYTAGWITGMFMLGRTVAGIPWGMASDKWGRKPCLIASMFNIAVLGLVFGFSTSFSMAVTLRFFIGLGNGFMGVAKTTITEFVATKEHEVRAFGYLNGIWGLGLIVGPAIGGLLARPATQYPTVFSEDGLWGHYPYLLPSIICSSIAITAGVGIFFFLPETLKIKHHHTDENGIEMNILSEGESSAGWSETRFEHAKTLTFEDFVKRLFIPSKNQLITTSQSKSQTSTHSSSSSNTTSTSSFVYNMLNKEDGNDENDELFDDKYPVIEENDHFDVIEEEITPHHHKHQEDIERGQEEEEDNQQNPLIASLTTNLSQPKKEETKITKELPKNLQEILNSKQIRFLFSIYTFYCFAIMFVDETFPLWCVTSLGNGGLGWESAEVGETLASIGLGLVIFQLFAYEWMIKKYFNNGAVDTYSRLIVYTGSFIIALPFVADWSIRIIDSLIPHPHTKSNMFLRFAIIICWLCYRVPATSAFSTLAIVVNSSVDTSMRGTMNGLIMTAGSIGNGLGPILGSALYALFLTMMYGSSEENHRKTGSIFPVDGRIVFIFGGLMSFLISYLTKKYMQAP